MRIIFNADRKSQGNKCHTSFIPLTENSNGEVKQKTNSSFTPTNFLSHTAQEEGQKKEEDAENQF